MSRVRVLIATTAGPVAVQRITEEDPDVNSVVCLAGKAVALPISAAYDAFVRDPTGVVQRHFGHPAYRIDVSDKIDEGYSWQLGLFVAHALYRADRLAGEDDTATITLVVTGEVNRDLNVLPVNQVREKLEVLSPKWAEIMAHSRETLLALPYDNPGDTTGAGGLPGDLAVLRPRTVGELLEKLDLPVVGPAPTPRAEPVGEKRSSAGRTLLLALFFGLVALGAVAAGVTYSPALREWAARANPFAEPPPEELGETPTETAALPEPTAKPQPDAAPDPAPQAAPEPKPEPAPEPMTGTPPRKPAAPVRAAPQHVVDTVVEPAASAKQPAPDTGEADTTDASTDVIEQASRTDLYKTPVKFEITEVRSPAGHSCTDVREKRVEGRYSSVQRRSPVSFNPSPMGGLCTVEIRAVGLKADRHLMGRYLRWTQRRPGGEPDKVIDLGPKPGAISWSVDIPQRLRQGAAFRIVVFSSDRNFDIPDRVLERITEDWRSPDAKRIKRRLKKRGISVNAIRYAVVPDHLIKNRPPKPRLNPGG